MDSNTLQDNEMNDYNRETTQVKNKQNPSPEVKINLEAVKRDFNYEGKTRPSDLMS